MTRRATADDAAALALLCNQVQDIHVADRPDVFIPSDVDSLAEWFRARLAEPVNRAWMAHQAGDVAAYVYVTIREGEATPFTPSMRWLEIVQLGVSPAHRRRGLARTLLERVVEDARREQIHDIRLKAWAFNVAAQDAFRRLGFAPRSLEFELRC